jgi:ABC-2 type transport system permease protein
VLPAAWLTMGSGVDIGFPHPVEFVVICVLVAAIAGTGGLLLGCSVGQTQIGLMFSMVIAPMMMFGCAYYPWSKLAAFPVLQYAVLINPLVYASEGLRGTIAPQFPHIPLAIVMGALVVLDAVLLTAGLKRFNSKAVS